jgi:hypothetical protein
MVTMEKLPIQMIWEMGKPTVEGVETCSVPTHPKGGTHNSKPAVVLVVVVGL